MCLCGSGKPHTCTLAGKELAASVDLRRNGRILARILILHPDTASTGDEDWEGGGRGEGGGGGRGEGGERERHTSIRESRLALQSQLYL